MAKENEIIKLLGILIEKVEKIYEKIESSEQSEEQPEEQPEQ